MAMTRIILAALVLAASPAGAQHVINPDSPDDTVTMTIECKSHCHEWLEGMQAPPTSDLDRAMEICRRHSAPSTQAYATYPPSPVPAWQYGWESCDGVNAKWEWTEMGRQAREQAARDAADLAFVKRVAGQP